MSTGSEQVSVRDSTDLREVYINTLEKLIYSGKPLMLITADFTYGMGMLEFSKRNPENFINMGIAEQNMASFAAGLAEEGYIPFIHTFAVFASRRALDQIYISAAYSGLNVKVVGADPGYASGHNGGTHMAMEDLGIFRTIPKALIVEPTDATMMREILPQIVDYKGFTYIRLYRKTAEKIYPEGTVFEIGKAMKIREGKDLTIITGGRCVSDVMEAAAILEEKGVSVRVLDMFTIKPLDEKAVKEAACETGGILVVENHAKKGGIGTAVLETLSGENYGPIVCMGREDVFGEVGTERELKEKYHLTSVDIAAAAVSIKKGTRNS